MKLTPGAVRHNEKAVPRAPEGQRDFLEALAKVEFDTPGTRCIGLFWWEPVAAGSIAKRPFFDDNHNALEAIEVFNFAH